MLKEQLAKEELGERQGDEEAEEHVEVADDQETEVLPDGVRYGSRLMK